MDKGQQSRSDQDKSNACRLPLNEAIQLKLVTDYKVYFPLVHEEGQQDQVHQEVSALKDADATILSKAFFLVKAMLYDGARKCIVYLETHDNVHAFYNVVTKLAVDYFGLGGRFKCSTILSSDSPYMRTMLISEFSKFDGFGVLLNCNILSRAVDNLTCDSIFSWRTHVSTRFASTSASVAPTDSTRTIRARKPRYSYGRTKNPTK